MTLEETAGYVRNPIEIVGGDQGVIDGGAIEAVYRRAKGVPRLTNTLCDLCFVAAFGEGGNVSTRSLRRARWPRAQLSAGWAAAGRGR